MICSKNNSKKQGFILLEAILSIALFFIVFATTSNLIFKLQEKSTVNNQQSITLLKLEATKQFLHNNKNLTSLIYSDEKLYYNGNLLLSEVSKFTMGTANKITMIDICINKKVCTKWKLKN